MRRPDTSIEVAVFTGIDYERFRAALAGFRDTFCTNPDRGQEMIDADPASP